MTGKGAAAGSIIGNCPMIGAGAGAAVGAINGNEPRCWNTIGTSAGIFANCSSVGKRS